MDSEARLEGVQTLSGNASQIPVHPFLQHMNSIPSSSSGLKDSSGFTTGPFHTGDELQQTVDEHHEKQTLLHALEGPAPWTVGGLFSTPPVVAHSSGPRMLGSGGFWQSFCRPFFSSRSDFSNSYMSSPSVLSMPSGDGFIGHHGSLHSLVVATSAAHPQLVWLPGVKGVKRSAYTNPIDIAFSGRAPQLLPQTTYFKQLMVQVDVSDVPLPLNVLLQTISEQKYTGATHILQSYGQNFPYSGMLQQASAPFAYKTQDIQLIATHCASKGMKIVLGVPIVEDMQFILKQSRWSHLAEVEGDTRYANLLHGRVEAQWRDMVLQQQKLHKINVELYEQRLGFVFNKGDGTSNNPIAGVYVGGKALTQTKCVSCVDNQDEETQVANRYAAACAYTTSLCSSDQEEDDSYSSALQSSLTQSMRYECYVGDGNLRTWADKELGIVAASYPKLVVAEGSAMLSSRVPLLRYHQWNKYASHFGMGNLVVAGSYAGADSGLVTAEPQARLENAASWHVLAAHYQIQSGALLSQNDSEDLQRGVPVLAGIPYAAMQSRAMRNRLFDRDDRREVFGSFQLRSVPLPARSLSLEHLARDFHEAWAESQLITLVAQNRVEAVVATAQKGTSLVDADVVETRAQVLRSLTTGASNTDSPVLLHEEHLTDSPKMFAVFAPFLRARADSLPLQLPAPAYQHWNAFGASLTFSQMLQAVLNTYGNSSSLWTDETAPHSVRVISLFACTTLAQYYPLHALHSYALQHSGINIYTLTLDTISRIAARNYADVLLDIPVLSQNQLLQSLENRTNAKSVKSVEDNTSFVSTPLQQLKAQLAPVQTQQ